MTRPARWAIATLAVAAMVAGVATLTQLGRPRWFALIDRTGQVERLGEAPRSAFALRVSPDGTRLVYDQWDGTLWIAPLRNVSEARPLAALPDAQFPLWDGDATRVFYIAAPDDEQALFFTPTDGSSVPRDPLREKARAPESWSTVHDGLTFITLTDDDYDVWFYSMADRRAVPVAALPGSAQLGSPFSPDGRWIAYESDHTGNFEIYVTSFPATPSSPRQVTRGGGRRPQWSHDGRELFFDNGDRVFVLDVMSTASFGTPKVLPITGFVQGDARRQYDLLPDGRFLMLVYGAR